MNDTATAAPPRRRLIGFNLLSGIVLLIVGFYFGWWLGHQIEAESLDRDPLGSDGGHARIPLDLALIASGTEEDANKPRNNTIQFRIEDGRVARPRASARIRHGRIKDTASSP